MHARGHVDYPIANHSQDTGDNHRVLRPMTIQNPDHERCRYQEHERRGDAQIVELRVCDIEPFRGGRRDHAWRRIAPSCSEVEEDELRKAKPAALVALVLDLRRDIMRKRFVLDIVIVASEAGVV